MSDVFGFELLSEQEIPEINSRARFYRHRKTGAELLSVLNDDENKVFGITFRTPPADSTGVAHILEHSVLNGSRKYPVKEPFVELIKGSLNTFLNAFTYPDKTCYPVASQNLQDFYNLIDVYLDAVLYPLISPYIFMQEGWHYELDAPDEEMTFKGVVFNEMKGSYSNPESVLDEEGQQHLYTDNAYRHNSGGDPTRIPDLTYQQFKAFHQRYYHPSNARIFFYGDDDPEKRLEILDQYLRDFERIQVDSSVELQPSFSAPRKHVRPYEVSEGGEAKSLTTVSWMLPQALEPEQSISMNVLNHILIGSPASPLRKALIESGLGEDLTGPGLIEELRQPAYSIGMKGVAREQAEAVEMLILSTLAELVKNGIDPETVAASINTVEFRMREMNTGSYPRGLIVMLQALSTWLYDSDPLATLRYEAPLDAIKQHIAAADRYFERWIESNLLNNTHRVTIILEPDAGLAQRRTEAEKARLDQTRAAMPDTAVSAVIADTTELKRRQETPDSPEALATIPTLKLADLDRNIRKIPSELIQSGADAPRILYHDLFTNGILYLDLGFDLHTLPQDWLPYIPLLGRTFTEMGTRDQTYVQLLQRIGRATGGISTNNFIATPVSRPSCEAWLFLRGKVMVAQTGELLAILRDVLSGARLDDVERFRQMALEEKASLEAGLVRAGHRYVNTRLRAQFNEAGWASEQTSGISYLFFLRDLLTQIDKDWPAVLARLEAIRARLLNRGSAICNVTLDGANWANLRQPVTDFLAALPSQPAVREPWQIPTGASAEGLTVPSQVNYVGKAGSLYDSGYTLDGSVLAIMNIIDSTWLWSKVRVEGGAYGGFASFDSYSGILSYLSYRDPNLLSTLQVYDQTAEFLRESELPEPELVKSIIGAIGSLDAYQLPDAKGFTALQRHLMGVSDERRQKLRAELLEAQPADFQALASFVEAVAHNGKVAVIGSSAAIQSAATERPNWLEVKTVL
jgi:presequence protease